MRCTECGRDLEELEQDRRIGARVVPGRQFAFRVWQGTVCEDCPAVYCPRCLPTRSSPPCPKCGRALVNAFEAVVRRVVGG